MINKVVYDDRTLIDLTNDTVTPMSLDEGITAHDASGNIIIGTATRGLPVGFEYFQTNPNIQAGSIPFVGGLWDRTIYADLWAWVQTQEGYLISEDEWQALAVANNGAVPYYSTGDGSTNFRVPALSVWVKGAASVKEIGDYLGDAFKSHKHDTSVDVGEDGEHTHTATTNEQGNHTHTRGTMNITGSATIQSPWTGASGNGSLWTTVSNYNFCGGQTYQSVANGLYFDASKSWTGETSSVGNHTHTVSITNNGNHTHTVNISEGEVGGEETRPKTIVGIYCVVAFGYVVSNGEVSLEKLENTLERVESVIQSSNFSTIAISQTQPSPSTKVWIKPI